MVTTKEIRKGSIVWTNLSREKPLLVNDLELFGSDGEIEQIEVLYFDFNWVLRRQYIRPECVVMWNTSPPCPAEDFTLNRRDAACKATAGH